MEADFYGQLNWGWFSIQNRWLVSPSRNSFERRLDEQGMAADRAGLCDIAVLINDRLDDHSAGDVRFLGQDGVVRRGREDKLGRLQAASQTYRPLRFGCCGLRRSRIINTHVQQSGHWGTTHLS